MQHDMTVTLTGEVVRVNKRYHEPHYQREVGDYGGIITRRVGETTYRSLTLRIDWDEGRSEYIDVELVDEAAKRDLAVGDVIEVTGHHLYAKGFTRRNGEIGAVVKVGRVTDLEVIERATKAA